MPSGEFSEKRRSAGAARVRADLDAKRGIGVVGWIRRYFKSSPSLIVLLVWLLATWIVGLSGGLPPEITRGIMIGNPAVRSPVVARVDFVYRDADYERAVRKDVEQKTPPIYDFNADPDLEKRVINSMEYILEKDFSQYGPHAINIPLVSQERNCDANLVSNLITLIHNRQLRFNDPDQFKKKFNQLADKFFNPMKPAVAGEWDPATMFKTVQLRYRNGDVATHYQLIFSRRPNQAVTQMHAAFKKILAEHLSSPAASDQNDIIAQFNSLLPVAEYNDTDTQRLIDATVRARLTKKAGETLVKAGATINDAVIRLLKYHAAIVREKETPVQRFRRIVGNAGLVGVILFILVLWLIRSEPFVMKQTRQLFFFAIFSMVILALARWIYTHPEVTLRFNGISVYIVPVVSLAILGTLIFDERVSMGMVLASCGLIMVATGMDYRVFMVHASGGIVAAAMASSIRDRLRLLSTGVIAGMVEVVLIAMLFINVPWLTIGRERLLNAVLSQGASAWFSSFTGAVIITGMLPLIEAFFGILTNIRLYELSDASHPAQRKIAIEAPGTYTHTLAVMNLAETGAEAIGADPLLTKTGCLYHDLGKTVKPEYFVENMKDAPMRHAKLSPQMSMLIIANHVKDGIEMAREYGLPQRIIDFIPEHHGTTQVEYFYHKARENAPNPDMVREEFFRYPGPKPQSKETAIVMIADTIEAAGRTLDRPTPASVRKLVHNLILKKLHDGQFDECDLTFRDLKILEDVFVNLLLARHHSRIKYPDQKESVRVEPVSVMAAGSGRRLKNSSNRRRSNAHAHAHGNGTPPLSPGRIPAQGMVGNSENENAAETASHAGEKSGGAESAEKSAVEPEREPPSSPAGATAALKDAEASEVSGDSGVPSGRDALSESQANHSAGDSDADAVDSKTESGETRAGRIDTGDGAKTDHTDDMAIVASNAEPVDAVLRSMTPKNAGDLPVHLELRIDYKDAPAISRVGWNRLFRAAVPFALVMPKYPAKYPELDAAFQNDAADGREPETGDAGAESPERKKSFEVSVMITDDKTISELSEKYLSEPGPTDVMAFEQGDFDPETGRFLIGQIVVSCETARREAASRGMDVEEELRRYTLHGWLHLLGYDDQNPEERDRMIDVQEELLQRDHENSDASPTDGNA